MAFKLWSGCIFMFLGFLGLFGCETRAVATQPPPSRTSTAAPTTLYLIRHAEKETGPLADKTDPPLTDRGRARAEQLVQVLTQVDLAAVYSTPYQRAVRTVEPVATSKGLAVQTYNPKLDLRRLADSLVALYPGQAILIAGHSNTIPGILNALVHNTRYPELSEGDHDGLYRAVVLPKGVTVIDELRVPLCK